MRSKSAAVVLLIFVAACAAHRLEQAQAERAQRANVYLNQHPETSPGIRRAIETGEIVLGMCPLEVFASVGEPYFFHAKHDPKWPEGTDPVQIIQLQCSAPDSSRIELFFDSYFPYRERRRYKVLFEKGVVTGVEPL